MTSLPWASSEVGLIAVWDGRVEDAAQVASRTASLLTALAAALPTDDWRTSHERPVPSDLPTLTAMVESFVTRDDDGDPFPEDGFDFSMSSGRPELSAELSVSAGSKFAGNRILSNRVTLMLVPRDAQVLDAAAVEATLTALVQAFEPLAAAARDRAVMGAARGRGGFAPPLGYRTWIGPQAGQVSTLTDGVRSTEVLGGTLLTVPDDWPAEQAVAALTSTLAANGLALLPHQA